MISREKKHHSVMKVEGRKLFLRKLVPLGRSNHKLKSLIIESFSPEDNNSFQTLQLTIGLFQQSQGSICFQDLGKIIKAGQWTSTGMLISHHLILSILKEHLFSQIQGRKKNRSVNIPYILGGK